MNAESLCRLFTSILPCCCEQEAELEELREKADKLKDVSAQLRKTFEENRQLRGTIRSIENPISNYEENVTRTRIQHRRNLGDYPQTEKISRRRSQSLSGIDDVPGKCPPRTEKIRRRLRLDDDDKSFDKSLDGIIRDPSPVPTPFRSRTRRK